VYNNNITTRGLMLKPIPTIATFADENLSPMERVEKWTWQMCRSLEENYSRRWGKEGKEFTMSQGKKYWKILHDNSVHAFVDRKTGEVYKPASWKSPAKHVRFDMRLISERRMVHDPSFTDWAGGYLYLRRG
tara:strand:+ start:584 stop:979 length:396 start_codon:yes stop_codon:yes gene_type:complete